MEEDKEPSGENGNEAAQPPRKGSKEWVYDKIPLSVKQLDIIIVVLIAALIIFFVLGALKGNGII